MNVFSPLRHKNGIILIAALSASLLWLGPMSFAAEKFGPSQEQRTALQSGITLREALRAAYISNPTLQAARAELMGTHELLPQAQAGWKPSASANAGVSRIDTEGSNFGGGGKTNTKDVEVSFNQPLYRGGQTFADTAAARYTIMAQSAFLLAQEQNILLQAATAYMDVLRDRALLDLSQNNREVIAKQLEATSERYEVGELTKTDVSQAEARLARTDADVITAHGNLRTSMAVFTQITGQVPDKLTAADIELELPVAADETGVAAEDENPNALAAFYAHKAAKEDIDGVFGELLPQVGVNGSWNRTFDPSPGLIDKQTTKVIGITASVPLYEGGATRSRVRQAKHTANQRYLQILEARREARQEAINNWEVLQAARAEIRSREAQVEASQIAQEGVHAEADYGTRTILDSLDADQEALDAQVALVTAQRNEVVAEFALAATLGRLTPQTLGFSEDAIDLSPHLEEVTHKILDMDVDRVGP